MIEWHVHACTNIMCKLFINSPQRWWCTDTNVPRSKDGHQGTINDRTLSLQTAQLFWCYLYYPPILVSKSKNSTIDAFVGCTKNVKLQTIRIHCNHSIPLVSSHSDQHSSLFLLRATLVCVIHFSHVNSSHDHCSKWLSSFVVCLP